jgi:hypothetical protein
LKNNINKICFLFYSLAPGFSKLYTAPEFFLVGLTAPALLLPDINSTIQRAIKNKYYALLIILILLMPITSLYLYLAGELNGGTFLIGFFTFYTPLFIIGIAFLIYPLSPIYSSPLINELSMVFLDGAAALRLASISGSLAFSGVAIVGLSFCCFDPRPVALLSKRNFLKLLIFNIFLVSAFLSLQRSIWVAIFIVLCAKFFLGRQSLSNKICNFIFTSVITLSIFLSILWSHEDLYQLSGDRFFSFIRTGGLDAVSERNEQWALAIENFLQRPYFGWGIGQIGQSARNYQNESGMGYLTPDGDYFRIISEFGVSGIILILFIAKTFLHSLKNLFLTNEEMCILKKYSLAYICLSFQMIGSNVTEFYFINTVYWALFFRLQNFK